MKPSLLYSIIFGALTVLAAGCSGQAAPGLISNSQSNFDQGCELLSLGKFAEALPFFDSAVTAGVLDPDQYAEALLRRAQCRALTGDLALAEEDIELASQGAPSEALLLFTKGVIYHAQGKSKESKEAFSRASRLDAIMKTPQWLP